MAVLDQEDQLVAAPEDMEQGGVLRQPNGQPGAWVTPPQSGVLPPVGLPRGASITGVAPGDVMPPVAQAGTGIISTPGGGAYVAHRDPSLAYAEINAQKQKDYELAMEQWQRGKTMEQIEAGVQANTRQMGMSGYQREIASGVPAAEALAKWAPMMFYGGAKTKLPVAPKPTYRNVPNVGLVEVSPTGQSRVVQQTPEKPPTAPPRMNVGGRGYIWNPETKRMEPFTNESRFKRTDMTVEDASEFKNAEAEMRAAQSEYSKVHTKALVEPTADDISKMQTAKQRMDRARAARDRIIRKYEAPQTVGRPDMPTAKTGASEFIEVTNPKGQRVRIKQSQLDDALKQGYTQ